MTYNKDILEMKVLLKKCYRQFHFRLQIVIEREENHGIRG